jgi:hypothetical protein
MLTYHFNFTLFWNLYEPFIPQRKPKTIILTILANSIKIVVVSNVNEYSTPNRPLMPTLKTKIALTQPLHVVYFSLILPSSHNTLCLCSDILRVRGLTLQYICKRLLFSLFQLLTQNSLVLVTTTPCVRRASLLYQSVRFVHTYYNAFSLFVFLVKTAISWKK